MHPRRASVLLALILLAASCGESEPPAQTPAGRVVDLVNPRSEEAAAGHPDWAHQQAASSDLDGDGAPERAVLIAKAGLYRERVLWDDGQEWQVYVEEADGTRTYVYKRFLQLGTLHARLARTSPGQPSAILLLEQTPQQLSVYEIRYAGPGQATALELVRREYDLRSLFEGTPDP